VLDARSNNAIAARTVADDKRDAGCRLLPYGRQPSRAERLRAFAVRELAGVALVVAGFLFARRFGTTQNLAGTVGTSFIVCGAIWYIVCRIGRRTWMSRRARIHLLAASLLCIVGVFAVLSVASNAREGPRPDTLHYWRYSNQTYGADSRVALRRAWIIALGVVWFATVLAVDWFRHRRRTQ
jgi:hypothetical protein